MRYEVICEASGESFPIEHITQEEREEAPPEGNFDPPNCPCCGKRIIGIENGIRLVEN